MAAFSGVSHAFGRRGAVRAHLGLSFETEKRADMSRIIDSDGTGAAETARPARTCGQVGRDKDGLDFEIDPDGCAVVGACRYASAVRIRDGSDHGEADTVAPR